ncbi:MAG: MBL fold metallo-hydrolase [Saprospiraceae bacterium]
MTHLHSFEFSPFAENTYVLWDDTKECVIFDPGCYTEQERQILRQHITQHDLKPVRLINTHCHLDHVFGNKFVADTWNLELEIHHGELPLLERFEQTCQMYGIPNIQPSPMPGKFLEAGETLTFGETALEMIFTPGHSPASLSFYCEKEKFLIAGDVLFYESIGRTDLPGGDFNTLIQSIRSKLFTLPGETMVYPGHGPATTIRHEMEYNPFL